MSEGEPKKRGRPKGFKCNPETLSRMSAAGKIAWTDQSVRERNLAGRQALGKGRPSVRDLTAGQREVFQLFRKNGFPAAEARAAALAS